MSEEQVPPGQYLLNEPTGSSLNELTTMTSNITQKQNAIIKGSIGNNKLINALIACFTMNFITKSTKNLTNFIKNCLEKSKNLESMAILFCIFFNNKSGSSYISILSETLLYRLLRLAKDVLTLF